MKGLSDIATNLWKILVSLATETPFTLAAAVLFTVGYYFLRHKFLLFLKSSQSKSHLPMFIQRKLDIPSAHYDIASSLLRFCEVALVIVAAIYLSGFAGLPLPSTIDDSESNIFKWVQFNSPTGGFSVDFPANPKPSEQVIEGREGKPTTLHHFTATIGGYQFDVTYWDFPDYGVDLGPNEELLNNVKDGSIRQVKGKIQSESPIRNAGIEGIDVYATVPNGHLLRAQYFMVNKRIYYLLALQPREKTTQTQYYRFFDSFKFY